jgi:hypothetical protein
MYFTRLCVEVFMESVETVPDPRPLGGALTRREHEILAFEHRWWKYSGAKERAVRELFGLSATRYYQVLNSLLDKQAALEADPMLVKRLRRQRSGRQRIRAARRLRTEIG